VLAADPQGPGRREQLERAAAKATLALGPAVEPVDARSSWSLATDLLRAVAAEAIVGEGLLLAEDHLPDLLLTSNRFAASLLTERRLAPLDDLTERAQQRMRETALAYVRHHGNAVAMASELHVHPQTARYRITRLRDLFGPDLDNPDKRFELELALRAS